MKNPLDVFRPKTPIWNTQGKGSGGKALGFYFIRISKGFPAQNCGSRNPFYKNVGVMTLVKRLTRTVKIKILGWIPQSPPILWVCSSPWCVCCVQRWFWCGAGIPDWQSSIPIVLADDCEENTVQFPEDPPRQLAGAQAAVHRWPAPGAHWPPGFTLLLCIGGSADGFWHKLHS